MKQKLRYLISEGKTKEALAELLKCTTPGTNLHNRVLQLSASYADYEKKYLYEEETSEELGVDLNKIRKQAIAIINELENDNQKKGEEPEGNEIRSSVSTTFLTQKRLAWLGGSVVFLIGVLANLTTILDWVGIKPINDEEISNVTVFVEDKNHDLVLKKQGYVLMDVEGGEAKKEEIDEKGTASFKNVKIGDKVHLKVDFSEPYRPLNPDSVYTVPKDGRIRLTVGLQNLEKVFGRVLYGDRELAGVIVAVGNLRDTTDDLGRYEISIPETAQRKEQEVFFKANGFKSITKTAFPQTNKSLNVVMERER